MPSYPAGAATAPANDQDEPAFELTEAALAYVRRALAPFQPETAE